MAMNFNTVSVEGIVIAVTKNDNSLRVVLKARDDYNDRNGNLQKREYILPFVFFGQRAEQIAKIAEKGQWATIHGKITSFKRDGDKYDSLGLTGQNYYLPPRFVMEDSNNNREPEEIDNPFEDGSDINW